MIPNTTSKRVRFATLDVNQCINDNAAADAATEAAVLAMVSIKIQLEKLIQTC
jgi:hypothetical protein